MGSGFLILAFIKYLFVPSVFSPLYYTFEILSLFVILGLIFFVNRNFMPKSNCNQHELQEQVNMMQKEKEYLLTRLKELEKEKKKENTFLTIKEKIISELLKILHDNNTPDKKIFHLLKTNFELVTGIVYKQCKQDKCFEPVKTYGLDEEWKIEKLRIGEGLHGQVIVEKRAKEITDIPEDYLEASSGTGSAQPAYIYFLPLIKNNDNSLLIEIASFKKLGLDEIWNEFLDGLNKGQN